MSLLLTIFSVAFLLNLLYELLHSFLYETCRKASLKKYAYLMLKGAIFDGVAITSLYWLTSLVFKNGLHLIIFLLLTLLLAYFWEVYSLKKGKWEYTKSMPIVFGVGLTPFIQLALTGFITLYLVF